MLGGERYTRTEIKADAPSTQLRSQSVGGTTRKKIDDEKWKEWMELPCRECTTRKVGISVCLDGPDKGERERRGGKKAGAPRAQRSEETGRALEMGKVGDRERRRWMGWMDGEGRRPEGPTSEESAVSGGEDGREREGRWGRRRVSRCERA